MTGEESFVRILHHNLITLERCFLDVMGKFQYVDGTVVFGDATLALENGELLKKLQKHLCIITSAHNWYLDCRGDLPDFHTVYKAMKVVVATLTDICHSTVAVRMLIEPKPYGGLQVLVSAMCSRMVVPMARVPNMVGRQTVINDVVNTLTQRGTGVSGPSVLLHGMPGIGKDAIMAEVVHHPRVQYCGCRRLLNL